MKSTFTLFTSAVAFLFFANRALFAIDTYKQKLEEREFDIDLMETYCANTRDRVRTGVHATICIDVSRRLAHPVMFHTVSSVLNDTSFLQVDLGTLIRLGVCALILLTLVVAWTKMAVSSKSSGLPMVSVRKKLV